MNYLQKLKETSKEDYYIDSDNEYINGKVGTRAVLYFLDMICLLGLISTFENLFFWVEDDYRIFADLVLAITMLTLIEWKFNTTPFKFLAFYRLTTQNNHKVGLVKIIIRNLIKPFTISPILIFFAIMLLFQQLTGGFGFVGMLLLLVFSKSIGRFLKSRKTLWYDKILKTKIICINAEGVRLFYKNSVK